ncbi:MAG: hypothetical protein HKN54_01445 [Flavobacteriaceae bacterium]|nr:hypothetical protein [Flavobacteriaceae bacterium]
MKNLNIFLFVFLCIPFLLIAQTKETDSIVDKPERPAFESSFIIDNPTNVLFNKNTLEVQMSHRFGLINGGTNDLAGFWAPSNIRIGLSYAILDRLTVGFGTTKFDRLQDFNWKVAIFRQTRSDRVPVSVSYYGNFTIDARTKESFDLIQHRYSYFNQIIIARRFSPNVSLQIAPSVSHYNGVESFMHNDRYSIAFGGRVKISSQTSILFDYSQPISSFDRDPDNPELSYNNPGVSIGVEFSTSSHAFQLFITNLNGIVPQRNYMKNTNDFFDGDFLIGFNITRIYNF